MVTKNEIFKRMLAGEEIFADFTNSWDDADVLEECGIWETCELNTAHYTWRVKYPLRIIIGGDFWNMKVGDTFWMDLR